jgi:hypothetical protein
MFSILIHRTDLPKLGKGVPVRINGHPTILKRQGDYLCYTDEDGGENRCKILLTMPEDTGGIYYQCASHGTESEKHIFVGADGVLEVN